MEPWILPVFGTLFLAFNLLIFIQLLYLPIGLSFDLVSKGMEIKYLLLKSKIINAENIESFGSTMIVTRSENYEGVLLHLKTGKDILLSNFNLKDISPLKPLLEEWKIEDTGKESFGFFSYYTQYFR